ncbi:MAG TPA: hypothetical protein VI933_04520 [archaeon]|nr:hypothetical protein [archaeon]
MKTFSILLVTIILVAGCTAKSGEINSPHNTEKESSSSTSMALTSESVDGVSSTTTTSVVSKCPDFSALPHGFDEQVGSVVVNTPKNQEFNGYKVKGTYSSPIAGSFVPCKKGSRVGENSNYYYCRDMIVNKVDASGNILDAKKMTVVLDADNAYVTTLC